MLKSIKATLSCAFAFIACALLTLFCFGAEMSAKDIEPYIFNFQVDEMTEDFSLVIDGWTKSEGLTFNSSRRTKSGADPYEGEFCGTAEGSLVSPVEGEKYVEYFISEGELADKNYICFAVFPEETDGYNCEAFLDLRIAQEQSEDMPKAENEADETPAVVVGCVASVIEGRWNTVICDISDVENKERAVSVRIGMNYTEDDQSADADKDSFAYSLDSIYFSSSENIERQMQYMSDKYYVLGGTLDYSEENMKLTFSGTDPFIETYALNSCVLENASNILIKLRNYTDCESIKFYYTTQTETFFDEDRYYSIPIEKCDDTQNIIIPAPEGIGQFRVVFEGNLEGTVEIDAVTCANYYQANVSGYGEIISCTVSNGSSEEGGDSAEITVAGSLTEDALRIYTGLRVQLYELYDGVTEDDILNGAVQSIAQTEVSEAFTLKAPLYDNGRTRLYSRFAIGVTYNGSVRILDSLNCITNPEALSQNNWKRPDIETKKGMNVNLSELYTLAPGYVTVEIPLDSLLVRRESELSYEVSGRIYYFNSELIRSIDQRIKQCYDAGVSVTLVFTLKAGGEASAAITPSGVAPGEYCTPAVTSYEANNMLRAAFSFISERYGSDSALHGRAHNYVFGHTGKLDTYGKTPFEFVQGYAAAFRTVYSAIKESSPDALVYVWIDKEWDTGLDTMTAKSMDSRTFIDIFSAVMKEYGDVSWNVAFDPSDVGYVAFSDQQALDSYGAQYITMKNIEALCRYFEREQLLYNGISRKILLLMSCGFDGENNESGADYIYSYYKAACLYQIDGMIVPYNGALTELFGVIDTVKAAEYSDRYLEYTGAASWEELISYYYASSVAVRVADTSELASLHPVTITGSVELWDFDGTQDGWKRGIYSTSISYESDFNNRSGVMIVNLGEAQPSEYRAIVQSFDAPMDFTAYPYLKFELQMLSLPQGVDSAQIRVICFSGNDTVSASAAVEGGIWKSLYMDISSFAGMASVDRIMILVSGADPAEDIGAPVLVLSSITASSAEHDSEYLRNHLAAARARATDKEIREINMNLVWVLVIIMITAFSVGVINIMTRIRHIRAEGGYDSETEE